MVDSIQDFLEDYSNKRTEYEAFAREVERLLADLLRTSKIDAFSVTSRAKDLQSLRDKIKRKNYSNPRLEVTDLCGARIVAYLESELEQIESMLRENFIVIEEQSIDKRKALGVDQLGYRSLHLMCSLSLDRQRLPEYKRFADFRFEVQIRTALQHAWAQVEWGRNYKLGGELPPELKRRLMLSAGALEILDREFSSIAAAVEAYVKEAPSGVAAQSVPLTPPLARAVLQRSAKRAKSIEFRLEAQSVDLANLVHELNDFGVTTVGQLESLFSDDFIDACNACRWTEPSNNEFGLARHAMMYADLERYLADAHQGRWAGTGEDTLKFLGPKYKVTTIRRLFRQHDILLF